MVLMHHSIYIKKTSCSLLIKETISRLGVMSHLNKQNVKKHTWDGFSKSVDPVDFIASKEFLET